MVSEVSSLGDQGKLGEIFLGETLINSKPALKEVRSAMRSIAISLWEKAWILNSFLEKTTLRSIVLIVFPN